MVSSQASSPSLNSVIAFRFAHYRLKKRRSLLGLNIFIDACARAMV